MVGRVKEEEMGGVTLFMVRKGSTSLLASRFPWSCPTLSSKHKVEYISSGDVIRLALIRQQQLFMFYKLRPYFNFATFSFFARKSIYIWDSKNDTNPIHIYFIFFLPPPNQFDVKLMSRSSLCK